MSTENFKIIDGSEMNSLDFNPYEYIGKKWFLIAAGNENGFNMMTAAWGFAGVMWGKNTFTAVIRPQRYTKEFVDSEDYFTVSFFDEEYRKALSFCGSNSGRDVDKVSGTGLSPLFLNNQDYSAVSFEEASLILVCRKAYVQKLDEGCFTFKENDEKWYPEKDYHVSYIGEIVKAYIKK